MRVVGAAGGAVAGQFTDVGVDTVVRLTNHLHRGPFLSGSLA
ncbi:hypothetical protein [Actinocatenispora rupis]